MMYGVKFKKQKICIIKRYKNLISYTKNYKCTKINCFKRPSLCIELLVELFGKDNNLPLDLHHVFNKVTNNNTNQQKFDGTTRVQF